MNSQKYINQNLNNVPQLTRELYYKEYKIYAQVKLPRLIEQLMLNVYNAEQTQQMILIQYAIQTRFEIYILISNLRLLKMQSEQPSTIQLSPIAHFAHLSYLSYLSSRSRKIKYTPEQLKDVLIRLRQLIQSIQTGEPINKKRKI